MSFGLCVVGCGQFAATFAQAIAPLRREIDLYFASRSLRRAEEYAASFDGAGAFGSYAAAAADPRVEAVYVCTPHHLHREHVELAAAAGKHVLLEKPIARSLPEAEAIIRATRQAGITFMVAENYHYLPAVRKCKELVEGGAIGTVRLAQLQEEARYRPRGWRMRRELSGGGVLIDGGIHKVHFLRCLLGEPATVYAAELTPGLPGHEGEDGVVATLRWQNGAVGLINHAAFNFAYAGGSHGPSLHWAAVAGSGGRVYFEVDADWLRLEQADREETLELPSDPGGLLAMAGEFMAAVRERRPPETPGEDGMNDLAVVLKAYESMTLGVAVAVT